MDATEGINAMGMIPEGVRSGGRRTVEFVEGEVIAQTAT